MKRPKGLIYCANCFNFCSLIIEREREDYNSKACCNCYTSPKGQKISFKRKCETCQRNLKKELHIK